ncbi:PP0621 family protein [Halovibrio sp. HP20-50]|uniref:PP0621 family protein n=1 Tax=Halovibrio sp. HP20-59 TaxID=3080275 RepID=UPI00294B2010|nr:PP0621 family protein [Halovibrio sp. HP20-59]MEA2120286.1 PP0621 family protein [Halovibrio sp. HP20-59]
MNLLIIRLIIFAVVFYVGLKLYGIYRQRKLEHEEQRNKVNHHEGGKMVRCRWCDVHVPEEEALRDQAQWFCSSAHRDRFLQEQQDKDGTP